MGRRSADAGPHIDPPASAFLATSATISSVRSGEISTSFSVPWMLRGREDIYEVHFHDGSSSLLRFATSLSVLLHELDPSRFASGGDRVDQRRCVGHHDDLRTSRGSIVASVERAREGEGSGSALSTSSSGGRGDHQCGGSARYRRFRPRARTHLSGKRQVSRAQPRTSAVDGDNEASAFQRVCNRIGEALAVAVFEDRLKCRCEIASVVREHRGARSDLDCTPKDCRGPSGSDDRSATFAIVREASTAPGSDAVRHASTSPTRRSRAERRRSVGDPLRREASPIGCVARAASRGGSRQTIVSSFTSGSKPERTTARHGAVQAEARTRSDRPQSQR